MEGISDIKIIGIDKKRPPRILKEPYINIYFVLSHKAIAGWCTDFNRLGAKYQYPAKIDETEGLYIDTWVRHIDEIHPQLTRLKATVKECSVAYVARIEAATAAGVATTSTDSAEQVRLNGVIAGLVFD